MPLQKEQKLYVAECEIVGWDGGGGGCLNECFRAYINYPTFPTLTLT